MGLIGKQVIMSSLPNWCWRWAQLVSKSHYYVIMLSDVGTHMGLIGKQNLLQLHHYMHYVIRKFHPLPHHAPHAPMPPAPSHPTPPPTPRPPPPHATSHPTPPPTPRHLPPH